MNSRLTKITTALFAASLMIPSLALADDYLFVALDDAGERIGQYEYELYAGESVQGTIYVKNDSEDETYNLAVSPVDAFDTESSSFDISSSGNVQEVVGTWITMEKSLVTLNSGEEEFLDFTLSIPEDATPESYMGAIMVSNQPDEIEGSGFTIATERGLRMYINLLPGERPVIDEASDLYDAFDPNSIESGESEGLSDNLQFALIVLNVILILLVLNAMKSASNKKKKKGKK